MNIIAESHQDLILQISENYQVFSKLLSPFKYTSNLCVTVLTPLQTVTFILLLVLLMDSNLKPWWDLMCDPKNHVSCHSKHAWQEVRLWDLSIRSHHTTCWCRGSLGSWSQAPSAPTSSRLGSLCSPGWELRSSPSPWDTWDPLRALAHFGGWEYCAHV